MVKLPFTAGMVLLAILCMLMLASCSDPPPVTEPIRPQPVAQVGELPTVFKGLVERNTFAGISVFQDRLLKTEMIGRDEEKRTVSYRIRMMDIYGEELAVYECTADIAYPVTTLTATADGGFLFVLGFQDVQYDDGTWSDDQGFASRIIKCDSRGMVQFDTALDRIEGEALLWCFEKNDLFYFFGSAQTSKTHRGGTYSTTDVSMIALKQDGTVRYKKSIAGSQIDELQHAEAVENGFQLSIRSESDDGDFVGSNSEGYMNWIFTVDDALQITEKGMKTGRDCYDQRIGEKDGVPVYSTDPLFEGFDAGTPEAYIDYGEFYLIVSEHISGLYEFPPYNEGDFYYYTETVYSGYDTSGKLLFRASVDSSPDYDALAQNNPSVD